MHLKAQMHQVCAIRDACRTFLFVTGRKGVCGRRKCNETVQCRSRRNIETQQNAATRSRIKGSSELSH